MTFLGFLAARLSLVNIESLESRQMVQERKPRRIDSEPFSASLARLRKPGAKLEGPFALQRRATLYQQ